MSTVVITGSTRGIGRGLADAFVDRGHDVVVSSRNAEDAETVAAELAQRGSRVVGTACDVSQPDAVERLWRFAVESLGPVDFWINNAIFPH